MKVLFVADPLERLLPKSDTSLYFLREFFSRAWNCYWAKAEDLSWQPQGSGFNSYLVLNAGSRENLPQLGGLKRRLVTDFDCILIRKEPPFDESYLRLCWLLTPYKDRVCFLNSPESLLCHHEKMIPMEAVARNFLSSDQIISSCVTESVEEASEFVRQMSGENLVLKPWLGHGGRDVKLLDRKSFLQDPHPHFESDEKWIIQAFEEEIFETGDRRVLFIGGKYAGDFVRLPKSGHFVSNLIRGGHAVLRPLNETERELTSSLEKFLSQMQIHFAGADYIASRLSEVNITSPTGLGSFEDLTGKNLAIQMANYILTLCKGKRSESY